MVDTSQIKNKSVAGAISYTLRTGSVYLIAVGATALLSAYLTPAEFGVFFIVTAIVSFFTFLSDVGLAATLVQKKTEPTLTELRTTFTVQQILALVIFLVIVLLTPVWQTQTKLSQEGIWLLYVLGFSFFLASLKTIPSILLERQLEFKKLAWPQVIEQLVFYTVVVGLAYTHHGVTSFTWGVMARGLVGVIVIYRLKRWPIGLAFNRQALRDLAKFGVKFQLNDLLARLKDDLYFIVLAKFFPVTVMGYLGWAKKWSMFPYQFSVQNIIAITFPAFSRIQDNKLKVAKGLEVSLYFISLIIFPLLTGMSVLAPTLIEVIPAYAKWEPALLALYFFCLNIALASIANPFISALNALGKINTTLKLMTAITLVTWGLTPIAVTWWGYVGVAVLSVIAAGITLLGYWMVKRVVPVTLISQIWRQALAAGIMGLSLYWLAPIWAVSVLGLVIVGLIGGLVFVASFLLTGHKSLFQNIRLLMPPKSQTSING